MVWPWVLVLPQLTRLPADTWARLLLSPQSALPRSSCANPFWQELLGIAFGLQLKHYLLPQETCRGEISRPEVLWMWSLDRHHQAHFWPTESETLGRQVQQRVPWQALQVILMPAQFGERLANISAVAPWSTPSWHSRQLHSFLCLCNCFIAVFPLPAIPRAGTVSFSFTTVSPAPSRA